MQPDDLYQRADRAVRAAEALRIQNRRLGSQALFGRAFFVNSLFCLDRLVTRGGLHLSRHQLGRLSKELQRVLNKPSAVRDKARV
jgi:hypothetical protein